MRIAVTGTADVQAIEYRANDPARAMLARGHTVIRPIDAEGHLDFTDAASWDVLHMYRFCGSETDALIRWLNGLGVAVTWDNDDNLSAYSAEIPPHVQLGKDRMSTFFRQTVATARLAQVATFPSATLAEVYESHGVEDAVVIENAVRSGFTVPRAQRSLVVGWIAGGEHAADLRRLDLARVLRRIQAKHPHVHVQAIGVDLELTERYSRVAHVPFDELPRRIAGFDIGIAPLADLPFNRSRSNIKIKEYAAAGVPWLASPVGPYLAHADGYGGRLVANDAWFDELDRLIVDPREQERLANEGRAWGKTQRIDRLAPQWEAAYERAIARLGTAR